MVVGLVWRGKRAGRGDGDEEHQGEVRPQGRIDDGAYAGGAAAPPVAEFVELGAVLPVARAQELVLVAEFDAGHAVPICWPLDAALLLVSY